MFYVGVTLVLEKNVQKYLNLLKIIILCLMVGHYRWMPKTNEDAQMSATPTSDLHCCQRAQVIRLAYPIMVQFVFN